MAWPWRAFREDYDALSLALEPVFAARTPLRAVDITFDARNVSVTLRRIVGKGFDRLLVQSDASDCFEKAGKRVVLLLAASWGASAAWMARNFERWAGISRLLGMPKSIGSRGSEPTCREGKRPTTARAHR